MSYQTLSESRPVARKDYRCVWCYETILAGTKHLHAVGICDGIQDDRWHLECAEASEVYSKESDEFLPGSFKRGTTEEL